MLTVAKNYWNFFCNSLKCNLKSVAEYKKSFFIQSVCMIFNDLFFLVFWIVVFNSNNGNINGTTMNDIMFIWSIPTIAYGIANFFFGGTNKLGTYLLEGGLDSFLVQPKSVIISVMLSGMEFSAFGDLLYGAVVGFIAVEFNIAKFILLLILGIISSIFFICTQTIIRLLTVFIGNTDNIERVYTNSMMINFASYPEVIYGSAVKFLIYTIIPSAYVSFVPIKIITTFDFKFVFLFIIALISYVGITFLISKNVFKYESGNNIALKG